MIRLDRNDSLALLRILISVERQVSSEALRMAKVAIRNDRQFDEVQKSIRFKGREARELCLKSAQDLGFIDQSITPEDLRHMR